MINTNYRDRFEEFGGTPDRVITPRLVLVHTLAHLLIDQWSLDSGYPAASLRERLYIDEEMAGFLIYTATSDSAGSLGGVVAEAKRGRLEVFVPGTASAGRLVLGRSPLHRIRAERRRRTESGGLSCVLPTARG